MAGARGRLSIRQAHTLVLGSGAAGLAAAVALRRRGMDDVVVVTEGLSCGTSINTGSDKQTYYKLGLCGDTPDSPVDLAETLFSGGSMHGDLAMVEAACSVQAFMNLVQLGVAFPHDRYGQFAGYKTDHDPRQRATSVGPYTSRDMCRALIAEARRLGVRILEERVAVSLLTVGQGACRRASGVVVWTAGGSREVHLAENTVFALGGPGGLYRTSVYPVGHTGGIGLALEAGALAQNLAESQYGLASTAFRWNVSGTYMQVIPAVVSTDADGHSNRTEFLLPWFDTPGEAHDRVFLKGYQWPFDTRKMAGGSSLVDILVYIENVVRRRRVFLDFRADAAGFSFDRLGAEARDYLLRSGANQGTPFDRLQAMNPGAVGLYRDHGIDLATEPLEVAVCAQHNNGGLAGTLWWESVNLPHLFPVGEVNGSHGVCRPGGSALNAGQVGALRAASFIAGRRRDWTLDRQAARVAARGTVAELEAWLAAGRSAACDWQAERAELQERMTAAGAHIRSVETSAAAAEAAAAQWQRVRTEGCRHAAGEEAEALRTRSLVLAHRVYLDAIAHSLASGVGSRGSAMARQPGGTPVHPRLPAEWAFQPENPSFREQLLETRMEGDTVRHGWVPRRPLPSGDTWFENVWAAFRDGRVFE